MNIVKAIALLEKCLSEGVISKTDNLTAGCDGVVRISKRGRPAEYVELGELGKLGRTGESFARTLNDSKE